MAILKIYGTIVDGEEGAFLAWHGVEHVSLSQITDFLEWMHPDDDKIDILINSRGGNVQEGWAIYDALRSSGKEITATVEGVCASMASIVLMAAPKERRFSAPHASFCIHEPRYTAYSIGVDATSGVLARLSDELRIETQRFVELYAERTGTPAEELAQLMAEDREIDAEEALSYGFIGAIKTPNTALTPNNNKMAKKSVIARILQRAVALLDGGVAELRLTTTTGVELVVETDADDPKVGDSATPDGEHTLEDGRIIVVTDGVITEIREKEEAITEEEQAMLDTIEQLTARVEQLSGEIATLKASQKSAEEVAVLEMVSKAGGMEWLKKVAVSNRPATQRTQPVSKQAERVSRVAEELEKLKNKNQK